MKNFDLVSIITATYNSAEYIIKTIESIKSQTYENWELLITDDCSTDRTCEIIRKYAEEDKRIKLFVLSKNSGAGLARNNSIREASGRFISFCDSDDFWHPDKLEKQLNFMTAHGCAMSYTSYMTCDEKGIISGIVVCRRSETLASMCKDDKIGFLTLIYDTNMVGKVYMPTMRKRQDWALKLQILQRCKIAQGMKEPLAYYRKHKDSISSNKLSLIKYNIAVYKEILGWSSFKAYTYFYLIFLPTHIKKLIFLKYLNV